LYQNIWLKISAFNSLAVLARIGTGWIINKIIAIYVGPEGTGLTEQLRNFTQTVQGVSTLGINEGVTKYSSKYQNNKKQLSSFLASTYKIVLITSLMLSMILITFSGTINQQLFGDKDLKLLIIITGILVPIFALNSILIAILNGFQEYKKVIYINIVANIATALVAINLIINLNLFGALLLVLITQVISFVVTLLYIRKDMLEIMNFSLGDANKLHYKRLYGFIAMALVSAITIPIFNIFIRNLIINHFQSATGVSFAGYWDAVKKITSLFLSFVTPIFSLYYYPQLSKINTNKEFQRELKMFFKQLFPLFLIGMIILFFARHWAIILFFTDKYTPAENLFKWQLAGDLLRIVSLTVAYLMLAKTKVLYYITTEIGFWMVYYLLSSILIKKYELEGVPMAYFISYLLYLIFIVFLFRKTVFSKKTTMLE